MQERRIPVVPLIVAAQAAWLAVVAGRGWYSGPDLANLSAARDKDLTVGFLTASVGGHFGAPTRLLYWLLAQVAPLSWALTVGLRVGMQALATYLLWKLLRELVGERPWLPVVVALYAFSPLLVPGFAVLSSGLPLSIGQSAVLGSFLLHVRYTRTGLNRQALGAAALALVSLVYADQSLVCFLLLPVLSLGFLRTSPRERWLGWALMVGAAVAFGGLYSSGDYTPASGRGMGVGQGLGLLGRTWFDVLGPALVGGPWTWRQAPNNYSADASPQFAVEVLGQVVLVALVVWSVRRTGLRALLAWAMPVVVAFVSVIVVGLGRYDSLGNNIPYIVRYSHLTALALALGVTLAFARTPEEGDHQAAEDPPFVGQLLPVALLAVLVASVVSGAGFAQTFWKVPSKGYVDTLAASARATGTSVQVWDGVVPPAVIPPLEPNHFVSDVLKLTDQRLRFDGLEPSPKIVDGTGRLVDSVFVPASDLAQPINEQCGVSIQGAGDHTVQLKALPSVNSWFLQLRILQSRANDFTVSVRDAYGQPVALRTGSAHVAPTAPLLALNWALANGSPTSLTISSDDPGLSLCLVHAYVGAPFAQ